MGETAESTMGEKKACLGPEMKRKDGRCERCDIGDREGTEDNHCKQGTDTHTESGTKRGSGTRTEDQKRATKEDNKNKEDKGDTKRAKINIGGEQIRIRYRTGISRTVITPEMYRKTMGRVVAARRHIIPGGTTEHLETKGMFKTNLTTASGATKRTWVYVVEGAGPRQHGRAVTDHLRGRAGGDDRPPQHGIRRLQRLGCKQEWHQSETQPGDGRD